MRYAWVLGLLTLCVHSALAQNRPNIRWNIDAISGEVLSVSLTEQRDYLLLNEDGHAKLHRIDWLLQTRPLGTALVSYWLERGGVIPNLTDRCDTANGQEYIWWFTRNNVQVSRLIRSATTYGGAYLERKITTLSVGIGTSLALRGNTSQRAYNRLAALGLTNGNLRLVSVREPSNPADPLVIQNELEIAAHSGGVTAIAYDAGTRRLVTGGVDGLVRVWQLSGSLGALTLTPVSVFANGWGAVTGLNFASNSANQQLLITASDSLLVSGRLWNGGAPPLIPAWQTYIDPDAIADYSFFSGETRRLRIAAPEPSSRLIPVLIRTDISNEGDPCVLLDPDTGDVMYHFVWTAVNSINAFG
ncbi:MAG: hypothetical protein NZM28_02750, partial [Fimbriimonadales bacterium]|nr:hypothetical protein [Fimbriimonadales bacterium]